MTILIINFFIVFFLSFVSGYFLKTFVLSQKIKSEKDKFLEKKMLLVEEFKKQNEKEIILFEKDKKLEKELEEISGMKKKDVLNMLVKKIEDDNKEDLFIQMNKLENQRNESLEEKAKEIIAIAIQKISKKFDNNLVMSMVMIPNEEVKGKIIGKEGRNIKSFERETGVQLIVDETPREIMISSFDPIRREVAVRSLTKLIEDGFVNPAKIEKFVAEARNEVGEQIKKEGKRAAVEVGIHNIPKEVLDILGKLHFRSSYGQNVLEHSIEMAHIAGIMAEELGADPYVARAGALLHDIGKALDFETKGDHIEIGRKILKKYRVNNEVIKAMQTHHNGYPNENLESYIVDAADAISGGRPGARSDNADMYIKKLEGLERITNDFEGVSDAYALSAGREIRVFVKPDEVSDLNAAKMAREIAIRIEKELKYPGEIKIALIREKKVVEYAR